MDLKNVSIYLHYINPNDFLRMIQVFTWSKYKYSDFNFATVSFWFALKLIKMLWKHHHHSFWLGHLHSCPNQMTTTFFREESSLVYCPFFTFFSTAHLMRLCKLRLIVYFARMAFNELKLLVKNVLYKNSIKSINSVF